MGSFRVALNDFRDTVVHFLLCLSLPQANATITNLDISRNNLSPEGILALTGYLEVPRMLSPPSLTVFHNVATNVQADKAIAVLDLAETPLKNEGGYSIAHLREVGGDDNSISFRMVLICICCDLHREFT
jgi:hypothetical protein